MVYDDGLTYYELLSKVIAYINNLIEDNKTMINNIDAVREAFNELQNYVNNYFENLDLDPIIDDKVDEEITHLVETGLLSEIITEIVISTYTPEFVISTENMTNKNTIYVLTSNKHIYCWSAAAERFIDTGIIFGDTVEYFTMRGVLDANGSIINPGDAGLYYLTGGRPYSNRPNGYNVDANAWEVVFTWSNAGSGAPANKLVFLYQGDRIWIGSRISGWFFDSYDSTDAINTSKYAVVNNESISNEIYGGQTNMYYGTIGRAGATGLYNAPQFDLRYPENRYLIIPVEQGNYISIKCNAFGVDNFCGAGFVSEMPAVPLRDGQNFNNILVTTSYSAAGKLVMLNTNAPSNLKIMAVNVPNIKYFIVSYRNMATNINNGYMLETLKVYKNATDYQAGIVLKDYLAENAGLKKDFENLKADVEEQITYDFEFNIENNYLNRYLNNVSYANNDDNYAFSLIAGNGNYKPMDDVDRDENGSMPVGYTLSWPEYEGANLVNYQIKFGNQIYTSSNNSVYIYNVIPGEYDFEISALTSATTIANKVIIKTGRAKVNGRIRMLNVDDIYNCRDIGGWSTIYGKKIKYGMLFRSAELDNATGRGELSEYGLNEFKKINVLAEIDIDENENASLPHYSRHQVTAYQPGLTGSLKNNYGAIINQMADNVRAGYGTLVHCKAGVDRTGTVYYLVEGLLGVDEGQLAMDYEISSMNDFQFDPNTDTTNRSQAYRNYTNFVDMVNYIKNNFAGDNINEKIEAMLLTLGATQENINYLRANCLE